MAEEDLYAVLGLPNGGPHVPVQDIRKGYRTRALVSHPDKQAGKSSKEVAAAAAEFEKIQRAVEILGDEKARKAYDDLREVRKSREEKEKQFSAKRQKMMQDLRDRERAFEFEKTQKREEDIASKRLKEEIARIRADQAKKRAGGAGMDVSGRQENDAKPEKTPTATQSKEMENTLKTTLKVSWTALSGVGSGYTAASLKEVFEEFGVVEDVVIRQSKSKGKGSALVVMKSKEAAFAAANSPCGDFSNPLLVVPAVPPPSVQREPVVSPQATALQSNRFQNLVGSSYVSFENDVLRKMRQKAERERIIKEMQEADAKET